MNLVLHALLAVALVALMREYDDAVVLALAGCGWMGTAIAARLGPLRRRAGAAGWGAVGGRLALGLITAGLIYGLVEQGLGLPGRLEAFGREAGAAAEAGLVGWTIGAVWLMAAVAPTLVRARRASEAEVTTSAGPAAWGLVGACLAGAPVALGWGEYGDAWSQGFLRRGDLVEGLPLLAPAGLAVVAGAAFWRRSLTAGAGPLETRGLWRTVMLGAAVAGLAQIVWMAVEMVRAGGAPHGAAAVQAGGAFLIAQAVAWTAASWRLRRAAGAGPLRILLACLILIAAMLLTAIAPGAVLAGAEWAELVALMMIAPLIAGVALSQTLIVWAVRRAAGGGVSRAGA